MFTMKYSQMAGHFNPTLQKLARMPLPTKTAYSIKKMVDAIQKEQKTMREAFTKEILEPHAKKDEKGAFLKDEHGDVQVDETKTEAFTKAQDEFSKKEFTVNREKLNILLFESINLSAAELSALDPILQDPEEAPEAPVVQLRK